MRTISGFLAATLLSFAFAAPADAATEKVVLVGDLQSELGCPGDWQPDCDATGLEKTGDTVWSRTFTVPEGAWQYKVALNGGWTENYGKDGVADGANLTLRLGGPVQVTFSYDDTSHRISWSTTDVATQTLPGDRARAVDSLRAPLTRERYYFVMADRFANGDRANDRGGLDGDRLVTGFDPTGKGWYHGGDLAGITDKLDYIKGLGTTAIWLTPSFKNKPVQGKSGEESAGYHGYWITDFTQIDPHLGTNAEMKALIRAAHRKGMKVFFDIITNHTADVIDYREGTYGYRSKKSSPYRDGAGNAFDDRDYIGKPFPQMDPASSFPYKPYFPTKADETAKVPAWLNDPLMYHNRGDSVWSGESNTYGDFIGLDDLFTERREVVEGMGDIYKTWVDFGIDGFRIDTVKHVNMEFWQQFVPDILGEAKRIGNEDFFAFGEVYDSSPQYLSQFTTEGTLQATLDFGFQARGVDFAKGVKASALAEFFAADDWYTDADSNAYQLPTFLGNHDMGRVAMFLQEGSADQAQLLRRVKLANELMFLTRGQPVTYYGDEQGFIGTGGDQLARQDMFASQVAVYNDAPMLAAATGARDRYGRHHPIYRLLAKLSRLRDAHPALADGLQQVRYAADGPGIFATSRLDRRSRTEYLVAANNDTAAATAQIDTWSPGTVFTPLFGEGEAVRAGRDGKVNLSVPGLGVRVWRAHRPIARPTAAPVVSFTKPVAGGALSGRTEIAAEVAGNSPVQASFYSRPLGAADWSLLGTDDNAPYRVFHDVRDLPLDTAMEYRVVVKNTAGQVTGTSTWAVTGAEATGGVVENGDPPAQQPGAVSAAGSHNTEMGCPEDWQPACPQAQLSLDAQDKIWKGTFNLTPGGYSFKAALDNAWTENYGDGGAKDGPNIGYETTDGTVSFYYDPTTHWVTSDENGPIVTAPGDFQTALGCGSNWAPDCMRPWLQDKDGDGTYTWSTALIGAGTYSFKIAHGLSWTENYGDGGVPDGGNITLQVPRDQMTVTFSYDSTSHRTTVTVT